MCYTLLTNNFARYFMDYEKEVLEYCYEASANQVLINLLLGGNVEYNKDYNIIVFKDYKKRKLLFDINSDPELLLNQISTINKWQLQIFKNQLNNLPELKLQKAKNLIENRDYKSNICTFNAYLINIMNLLVNETPFIKTSCIIDIPKQISAHIADLGTLCHNNQDLQNKAIFNSALGLSIEMQKIIDSKYNKMTVKKLRNTYHKFSPLYKKCEQSNYCVYYSNKLADITQYVFMNNRADKIQSMEDVAKIENNFWFRFEMDKIFSI